MSDDPTIDIKKRARRRLVGAAALALLAVIVLPVVMDSEPKPGGQEVQIRIPNRDSDSVVARVIPGSPAASTLQKNTEPPRQAAPAVPDGSSKAPEAAVAKKLNIGRATLYRALA